MSSLLGHSLVRSPVTNIMYSWVNVTQYIIVIIIVIIYFQKRNNQVESLKEYLCFNCSTLLQAASTSWYWSANAILRCFETRDNELLVRTFTTYVRPLLEYNSVIWSPHLKKDIEAIEKVQRPFTKRLSGLNTLSYSQRLKLLNLPRLELRDAFT